MRDVTPGASTAKDMFRYPIMPTMVGTLEGAVVGAVGNEEGNWLEGTVVGRIVAVGWLLGERVGLRVMTSEGASVVGWGVIGWLVGATVVGRGVGAVGIGSVGASVEGVDVGDGEGSGDSVGESVSADGIVEGVRSFLLLPPPPPPFLLFPCTFRLRRGGERAGGAAAASPLVGITSGAFIAAAVGRTSDNNSIEINLVMVALLFISCAQQLKQQEVQQN